MVGWGRHELGGVGGGVRRRGGGPSRARDRESGEALQARRPPRPCRRRRWLRSATHGRPMPGWPVTVERTGREGWGRGRGARVGGGGPRRDKKDCWGASFFTQKKGGQPPPHGRAGICQRPPLRTEKEERERDPHTLAHCPPPREHPLTSFFHHTPTHPLPPPPPPPPHSPPLSLRPTSPSGSSAPPPEKGQRQAPQGAQ